MLGNISQEIAKPDKVVNDPIKSSTEDKFSLSQKLVTYLLKRPIQ